jgi:EmrB/QacA subfamily drug resistance transporter
VENFSSDEQTNKNVILLVIAISSFLAPFMTSSINISLPSIEKDFLIDAVKLNWISSAYVLSAAVFLVPAGKLADIYGRKKFFLIGNLIYTIATTLAAIATSANILILARIIQGVGSAFVFSTNIAIITSVFPFSERGRVLGINVSAVYIGLTIGPFLGGVLTGHLGWRSIFFFQIPFCLAILLLGKSKIALEWAEAKSEKFDFMGSILYILFLLFFLYGLSKVPTKNFIILIALSALLFIAFFKVESKSKSPIVTFGLFRNNMTFAFSCLAAFINYTSTFAVSFLLSLFLQYIKDLSPQQAGLILLAQPIIMAIFSPLAGKLSDKIEPRVIASLGMALISASLFALSRLGTNTGMVFIIFSLTILGFGFALFSSPNANAIMSSVDKKFYGLASAFLGTMRLTGQMVSMAVAIVFFTLIIGKVRISPEHYGNFISALKYLFLTFGTISFVGIFASMFRSKIR